MEIKESSRSARNNPRLVIEDSRSARINPRLDANGLSCTLVNNTTLKITIPKVSQNPSYQLRNTTYASIAARLLISRHSTIDQHLISHRRLDKLK